MGKVASFLPECIDIEVVRETAGNLIFILRNEAGNPVDISLDDVKFTVKSAAAGTCQISTKTSVAGGHTDGPNGKVTFQLAESDTSAASERLVTCWRYELTRCVGASPTNDVVYAEGLFQVSPRVGTC